MTLEQAYAMLARSKKIVAALPFRQKARAWYRAQAKHRELQARWEGIDMVAIKIEDMDKWQQAFEAMGKECAGLVKLALDSPHLPTALRVEFTRRKAAADKLQKEGAELLASLRASLAAESKGE